VAGYTPASGRDRAALASRPSPYRVEFYGFREWLAQPDRLLGEMLIRALVDSGCFAAVSSPPYAGPVDYELGGVLERLEELDRPEPEPWAAGLGWRVALLDAQGNVLWRGRVDREQPSAARDPESVVAALASLVNDELDALVREVHAAVRQHLDLRPPEPDPPAPAGR
jgi:hypothetical protein